MKIIKIDASFFLTLFLVVASGNLQTYIAYLTAIFIHECGHLLMASHFKWKLTAFKLTGIGGFLFFSTNLLQPSIQKFAVASAGILMNLFMLIIFAILRAPEQLIYAQIAIIYFNLIPITPLDGSQMLQAIFMQKIGFVATVKWIKKLNILFLSFFLIYMIYRQLTQYAIVFIVLAVHVYRFHQESRLLLIHYFAQKHR